jgi:hypothetical protein
MRASETVPDQPSGAPYHPSSTEFTRNFNLPLSTQAHQQLTIFQGVLSDKQIVAGLDQWKYSWGNSIFSMLGNSGKPVTLETLSLMKFSKHVFQE